MGTEIIETIKFEEAIYQILLLDSKYTVYVARLGKNDQQGEKSAAYSAVASFDSLNEAKEYVAKNQPEEPNNPTA